MTVVNVAVRNSYRCDRCGMVTRNIVNTGACLEMKNVRTGELYRTAHSWLVKTLRIWRGTGD